MNTFYVIWLEGQGDTKCTIIDQEGWDWLYSPVGTPMPEKYRKQHTANQAEYGGFAEEYKDSLMSGSLHNDRALAIGAIINGVEASLYSDSHECHKQLKYWERVLGTTETARFEGYIY